MYFVLYTVTNTVGPVPLNRPSLFVLFNWLYLLSAFFTLATLFPAALVNHKRCVLGDGARVNNFNGIDLDRADFPEHFIKARF
jgi:hypothetical protein